jgi:hypothetical protein
MSRSLFPLCALALAAFAPSIAAAEEPVVTRVVFKDGRATIRGRIKGYETTDYVFPAGASESIKVSVKTNLFSVYFNLIGPGAAEATHNGSTSGNSYEGVAPVAGDYTARVYMMRSDARRGKTAKYTLNIAVGQTSAANEKGPDFADGLTGGPDYWEVTGVAAGDSLAIRATPSPKGKLVTRMANGASVKNLGCKNTRGQRWCRVSSDARAGWANGKFLKEGAGPR